MYRHNLNELWLQIKSDLKTIIKNDNYENWIEPIVPFYFKNNKLLLGIDNNIDSPIVRDVITDNYLGLIEKIACKILQQKVIIKITNIPNKPNINDYSFHETNLNNYAIETDEDSFVEYNDLEKPTFLNSSYTFDNFVEGPTNRFAKAAAMAVAENPGDNYNPLFIYGDVGLGKTHLMQAIGHYAFERNSKIKIEYITSENFLREFVSMVQKNMRDEFQKKYRNIDLLLIDDIQFITSKETQNEFFHTFNDLYNSHKQIVATSDRPSSELKELEDRLKNRFEMGLQADIKAPDLETRIAILQKKISAKKLYIPDNVCEFIAKNIKSNIRQLEGALKIISIEKSVSNNEFITVEKANFLLKDLLKKEKIEITPQKIQETVADYFGVSITNLKSKIRKVEYVLPRHIAMFLIRDLTESTLTQIGKMHGNRDHSSVLNGINKISSKMKKDVYIKETIDNLMEHFMRQN